VRNFVKLLREAKLWETEAEAEAEAEPGGKVAGARKANPGPAGEAAGAEESGPAGKATGADIEWHDEEGGDIADRLSPRFTGNGHRCLARKKSTVSRTTWSTTIE
jgi:hypothetical protein